MGEGIRRSKRRPRALRWGMVRDWELDADEALLRREDGVLTVVPVPPNGLLPLDDPEV